MSSSQLLRNLLAKRNQVQQADLKPLASEQSTRTISNEFNPLFRNEPRTQEAITACAKLLILGTCSGKDTFLWRNISEWIGGYEYILPAERTVLDELAILLIQKYGYKYFYKLSHNILCNFSVQTQKELIKWILDCNNSPILPC